MQNASKLTWLLAAVAIFLAGNLVFTGCSKRSGEIDEQDVKTAARDSPYGIADIGVQRGYLVFKDGAHFSKVLSQIDGKSNQYREELAKRLSGQEFQSVQNAYEAAVADLDKHADAIRNLADVAGFKQKWGGYVKFTDDELTMEPILFFTEFQDVLNKDGLIKIGDQLMKYYEDKIVYILNGDDDELANAASWTKDYRTDNIIVLPVYRTTISNILPAGAASERDGQFLDCEARTNRNERGSRRVQGSLSISLSIFNIRQDLGVPIAFFVDLQQTVEVSSAFKDRWPLGWRRETADLNASASFSTVSHGGGSLSLSERDRDAAVTTTTELFSAIPLSSLNRNPQFARRTVNGSFSTNTISCGISF